MLVIAEREKLNCVSDSTGRRDIFRTRTIIASVNGAKRVFKEAGCAKAKPFLAKIIEREKLAGKYLAGVFKVASGSLEDGAINYDYLPYESLQKRIGELLESGHFVRAHGFFAEYISKLDSLKRCICEPVKFYRIIAKDDRAAAKLDCFCTGVLDLLPRNILLIGRNWAVLDNEWCFEFAVPVKFVKFRAIRELAISLQRQIRRGTSAGNFARAVFGSGVNTYYVPDAWLEYLEVDAPNMGRMLRWEAGFQRYVVGCEVHVGRIMKSGRIKKKFMLEKNPVVNGLKRAAEKIPGFKEKIRKAERKMLFAE